MNATLLHGGNKTAEALIDFLENRAQCDFRFAVAYARKSGALLLEHAMREFLAKGGMIQGIVGINQGNTSHQGLSLLIDMLGEGLYLRCGRKGGGVFHPKLYFLSERADELAPAAVVIGSSNLTRGGFEANEECDVLLDEFPPQGEFARSVGAFWEGLRAGSERFATIRATPDILGELLECGALIDESKTPARRAAAPAAIEKSLSRILSDAAAPRHAFFAMTLSGFDVSERSGDPVILIPLKARDEDPKFWFWPDFFLNERKHSDLYLDASVRIDGGEHQERVRLYDYPGRSEFRLKSEIVKRQGREGDILLVHRDGDETRLAVIRQGAPEHAAHSPILTTQVSPKKRYGYFNRRPK